MEARSVNCLPARSLSPRWRLSCLALCLMLAGGCAVFGKRDDTGGEEGTSSRDPSQQRVRIFISGVQGEVKEAASRSLELKGLMSRHDASDALIQRVHGRGGAQMSKALQPFGYYHARVDSTLELDGRTWFARYRITPGEPTRIDTSKVQVTGPGGDEPTVKLALSAFRPKADEVLDHRIYEASKTLLSDTLAEHGYFDVDVERQQVAVSLATKKADIDLHWMSGPRYRFGSTEFIGSHLPDELVRAYLPYDSGEPYRQERLLVLQQRLLESDYFGEVEIETDHSNRAEHAADIRVRLAPAKRTIYSGGVSYGSDSGAGVQGSVTRRWINDRGHRLSAGAEISQRLNTLGTQYRIPIPGAERESWSFSVGYRDEETDSSVQELVTVAALRLREGESGSFAWGLGAQSGDFEVGGIPGSSTLLYPEVRWLLRRTDDALNPSRGWSLATEARAAPGGVGDTRFALVRAEAKLLRPVRERDRILARLALGALWTDDFESLPPTQRFFAGGDRSLRGFGFQALGPLNRLDQVAGGRYLAVASFEYERHLRGDFGIAGFVDAGNAFDAGAFDLAAGVGVGLRWRSPVGLVRVDLAHPVAGNGDGMRLHLLIGPEL